MKQEMIALAGGNIHANIQLASLPFSAVPGQSRLFLDYVGGAPSLDRFFPNRALLHADPRAYAKQVLEHFETGRSELCDALSQINTAIGAGPAVIGNIERLRAADAVAVVTGQQAGLFTGPLYTIYKAVSAIKFAHGLVEAGINAVPVFWAATEDHDMDEVSTAHFIDSSDALSMIAYCPAGYQPEVPVGSAMIDGDVLKAIDDQFGQLPQTEHSKGTRALVEETYHPGAGYGQAFAAMLSRLFSAYGLVLVDPMHDAMKSLAAPLYRRAVERSDEMVAGIRLQTAALESLGFHAQVLVNDDHFPLFWHDDAGRRSALRKVGPGIFRAKHDGREFTREQLVAIASDQPSRLSPNVMLRAVVQDHLLPTICYFGGAAEVAYFAQNSAAYEALGRPVTPIVHRQSFTVIEPRHRRALEKLRISFSGLFEGKEVVTLKAAEHLHAADEARTFADVEEVINTQLNRLDQLLSTQDPTLAANLATRRRKIVYHIAELRRKALLAAVRRDETAGRRIESIFANLLPNGALQERSVNVLVYLNKFGPRFVDWIYDAADLDDRGHRVIEL